MSRTIGYGYSSIEQPMEPLSSLLCRFQPPLIPS